MCMYSRILSLMCANIIFRRGCVNQGNAMSQVESKITFALLLSIRARRVTVKVSRNMMFEK